MRRSLTRDERLRSSRDIRELFAAAPRVEGRGLKLLHRGNGGGRTRFAVVVARGCGGAVRRNREKRVTREAWRSLKDRVRPGEDVVVLVLRFGAGLAERRSSLEGLVARAGLRRGQESPR